MMDKYEIKNTVLFKYIESNEAKYAQVGRPTLISIEDCDIVIERAIEQAKSVWYVKLLSKLQMIKKGSTAISDYIKEIEIKLK